ncbi:rhomboid family intramembrane serine protease [Mucilaginibacter sp. Bleaf8]|uniref:rhomboid family intramembrane serine protease n=1 Tax=Mucilaginibacter sp. Bleaf8 TaxID=2834430 RepID=UPI001BCA8789|nr:rhomboid family intramembrane serine protease [Mucilaginibacter sp. Bleaf8]MBS7565799.1 rhomboid family intramembrane serine protease [Mucilaginibacter sp. Bleaf8]
MEEFLVGAPVASVIFVITIISSLFAFSSENVYSQMILHPYSVARGKRVWTLITSGLIHGDWAHLIFNMFSFFFFAFQLEEVLGHWQFALLYIGSLILSDLPSVTKHKEDYRYHSLGASGAISAVVFGAILFSPKSLIQIFPIPFEIPAYIYGPLYLVYCVYASRQNRDNINHDAHFYGALSGIMFTLFLYPGVITIFLEQMGLR